MSYNVKCYEWENLQSIEKCEHWAVYLNIYLYMCFCLLTNSVKARNGFSIDNDMMILYSIDAKFEYLFHLRFLLFLQFSEEAVCCCCFWYFFFFLFFMFWHLIYSESVAFTNACGMCCMYLYPLPVSLLILSIVDTLHNIHRA